MKILITTPFFSNLGGSELETIHTANAFASLKGVNQIDIFVYSGYDLSFTSNIFINSKIRFVEFPSFFENRIIKRFNKELKQLFRLRFSPIESIYWKIKLLAGYDNVYVITKSTLDYYVPIIKFFSKKQKIIVKFTTIFFERMPEINIKSLSAVKANIVTSDSQVKFYREELGLKNTLAQEILVFKEGYALSKKRKDFDKELYDFGFLGRFSSEKQIEDTVKLIEHLKIKGYHKTLLLRGSGDRVYHDKIVKMVEDKGLEKLITIEFESVPYNGVFDFFDRINCFLITSRYEGGPNIGLEAMAYGLSILSYKVGAMPDRLKEFPEFLAEDFDELLNNAIKFLNYNDDVFLQRCDQIKQTYIKNYLNDFKVEYLKNYLFN